ncbi:hypothetical protein [Mammaliicoccus sciuri]|uniref:hypothetical protein n=1 Tax=Mammaliicoccus sciuri TaxID=1296 RepID=UPI0021D0232C|nr:hypothetical protein [Mammaliicoccus sciuri]UXV15436.1 hypothetical protein MUA89_12945 [Mammaliicoccus sciuri]UXV23700.1 hypothetical protein MUA49_12675 [Mammaliicoccus sciuri]
MTILNTRTVASTGIVLIIFIQVLLFINIHKVLLLLILYIFCSLLFNVYLLAIENKIVDKSQNARRGLINITLLRNLSKIIGFGLGALFYYVTIFNYSFILIVVFTILLLPNLVNNNFDKKNKIEIIKLKGIGLIFFLLSLGSVSVFTIPKFVSDLKDKGLIEYSSFPFILPGIFSVLYLKFLKQSMFNNNIKLKSTTYTILIVILLTLIYTDVYIWLQMFIFSLIVAISISLTIDLRAKIIYMNHELNLKGLLQFFNLLSAFSILVFSSLSLKIDSVPIIVLIFNGISSLGILCMSVFKGGFYEDRSML